MKKYSSVGKTGGDFFGRVAFSMPGTRLFANAPAKLAPEVLKQLLRICYQRARHNESLTNVLKNPPSGFPNRYENTMIYELWINGYKIFKNLIKKT